MGTNPQHCMKKLFLAFIILSTFGFAVGFYYYQQYQQFLDQPVFKNDTILTITKGQNFTQFSQNIRQQEGNGKAWQWRVFARLQKVGTWLKVGEFNISAQDKPLQMMQKIKNNQVIAYHFTIIEGQNWRELKDKLSNAKHLKHEINDFNDEQLLAFLSSNQTSLEGLFLPETYQFIRGDSDLALLKRAHLALKNVLNEQWANKADNLPYKTAYELLTMASIVEKETSLGNEREQIAGVFVRRLQKNMRLQTDPTVIYGLGENYDGDIKNKDLTTDTPYNTYTRHGLPPTPIAMCSADSIAASAHPAKGTALFFVANNRGGHFFSDTYQQHQQAVKAYLKGKKL